MPVLLEKPVLFPQEGINIEEFSGLAATGRPDFSLARLTSGEGWSEPAQRPEFDEFTLVHSGAVYVTAEDGSVTIARAGQMVWTKKGEKIQYSTPEPEGADYIALCIPAFSLELAHRDPA